jgi:phospholipase/carboxylesterase
MVLMHGVGGAGVRMMGLASALGKAFPNVHFYAPNGPIPYVPGSDPKNPGAGTEPEPDRYQWYVRTSEQTRQDGLYAVAEPLNAFIAESLAAHGLDESRCVVIGFSMGAITALNVMPRRSAPIGAFVAHSGYLFSPDSLAIRMKQKERFHAEVTNKTPACLIHGLKDTTLPWQTMHEAALAYEEAEISTEFHLLGGLGHAMDHRSISIIESFISRHLYADPSIDVGEANKKLPGLRQ